MAENPQNVTCPICRMPKQASKTGSITQWIAICRCDAGPVGDEQQGASVNFCSTCGKRIDEGRHGSFTQWVFRGSGDTCQCKRPGGPVKFEPAAETDFIEADEEELALPAGSFPIERYKPISVLGQGSSGTVYMCRDRLLNNRVAVKILHTLSAEQLVLFQMEAKATSKLNNEGIVKILDFGATESGVPYMVLECVAGSSLETWMSLHGPLGVIHAIHVFGSIAEALFYAHSNGIFHRDLKPSNILLVGEDAHTARLIDFGVAQLKIDGQELTVVKGKTLVGTPAYMSPDQADGKAYDARSEVYSFGCVLFEALTGTQVFSAETPLNLLAMHKSEQPPQLGEIHDDISFSDDLEGFVAKCLAKNPDDRFQDFREVIDALRNLRTEEKLRAKYSQNESVSASSSSSSASGLQNKEIRLRVGLIAVALFGLIGCTVVVYSMVNPTHVKKVKKSKRKGDNRPPNAAQDTFDDALAYKTDAREIEGEQIWAAGDDMYGVDLKKDKETANSKVKWVQKVEERKVIYEALNDNVVDEDLKELAAKPDLHNVSVRGCTSMTGVGFKYLKNARLDQLDIKWIKLSDEGAKRIGEMQSVHRLNACHIVMSTGTIRELCKLKDLRILYLCHCTLNDDMLKGVNNVERLDYLNIEGNTAITWAGIEGIKKVPIGRFRIFGCQNILDPNRLKKLMPNTTFEIGDYAVSP